MAWTATVVLGDCKEALRRLETDSVDALVTDPPAGISFMGKAWDSYESLSHFQDELVDVFKEALRVMKPGAHGLVWALPRTSHHTGMALERAGFELRDTVLHLFSSGMPKGLDIGKHVEGMSGWNTTLKPAHEVWWLVRKPLVGTVVENVLTYGVGGVNVDGCRVDYGKPLDQVHKEAGSPGKRKVSSMFGGGWSDRDQPENILFHPQGRWPSNAVFTHGEGCTDDACVDGCPVKGLDELSSHDRGGASRFFYTSKVSSSERSLPDGMVNAHPTAKSIKLMQYFVKLVTPPGGTVLDPFTGSGTTGVAALREGCSFVGVELDPEHHRVAELRLRSELEAMQGQAMQRAALELALLGE